MKIKRSKTKLNYFLFWAILFIVLSLLFYIINLPIFLTIFSFTISLLLFRYYYYLIKHGYIILTEDKLVTNNIFHNKSILFLINFQKIELNKNNITLVGRRQSKKISTKYIDESDKDALYQNIKSTLDIILDSKTNIQNIENNSNYAYLEYFHSDRDLAIELTQRLSKKGYDIWLDQFEIQLGANWDIAINNALENASFIIFLVTDAFVNSQKSINRYTQLIEEHSSDNIIVVSTINEKNIPHLFKNCKIINLDDNEF